VQLHFNRNTEGHQITSYGHGYFVVNDRRIESSIVVSRELLIDDWPATSIQDVDAKAIKDVVERRPEVVIIGSGSSHRFPDMALLGLLSAARIGFEVMGTGAACRTYNVLMSESREVMAMLIRIPESP
jgi:uncharacterized protein